MAGALARRSASSSGSSWAASDGSTPARGHASRLPGDGAQMVHRFECHAHIGEHASAEIRQHHTPPGAVEQAVAPFDLACALEIYCSQPREYH